MYDPTTDDQDSSSIPSSAEAFFTQNTSPDQNSTPVAQDNTDLQDNTTLQSPMSDEQARASEPVDSSAALILATKAFEMPYDQGVDYLTKLYSDTNWSDPEKAAQDIATTAKNYRQYNLVAPDASLNADASHVTNRILDPKLTQDEKLAFIEDWSDKSKKALYNNISDPLSLLSAGEKEDRIDSYRRELRRGVVAGDVGRIHDMIARGAEAALAPVAGAADTAFGTDIKSELEAKIEEHTNPKMDKDIASKVASTIGFMGGATGASLAGPVGAYSYLGAALVDQTKDVYNSVLQATNDPNMAKDAMYKSIPGNTLAMFATGFIGKGVASAVAKEATELGAVSGFTAGATAGLAQSLGTGAAITSATKTNAMPSAKDTAESALIGGLVGGAFGGATDLALKGRNAILEHPILFKSEKVKDVQDFDNETNPEENVLGLVMPKFRQRVSTTKEELPPKITDINKLVEARAEPMFESAAVEGVPVTEVPIAEAPITKIPVAEATVEPEITPDFASVKEAEDAGVRVINEPPQDFMPNPMVQDIVRNFGMSLHALPWEKMTLPGKLVFGWFKRLTPEGTPQSEKAGMEAGAKPEVAIRRSVFKDPADAMRVLRHEVGHAFDYMRSLRTNHPELFGPDTITGKLLDGFDKAKAAYAESLNKMPAVEDEALKITKLERPGFENNLEYRSNPKEIFADVFGAFIRDPEHVKKEAPNLYDVMHKSFTADPYLARMMHESEKIKNDPIAFKNYIEKHQQPFRKEEATIYAGRKRAELIAAKEEEKVAPKKAFSTLTALAINKFHIPRVIIDKLVANADKLHEKYGVTKEAFVEYVEGLYNKLYKLADTHNSIHVQVDKRLERLIPKVKDIGLKTDKVNNIDPLSTWKSYMRADHILKETTSTLESLKKDPSSYKDAVALLQSQYPDNAALKEIADRTPSLSGDVLEENLAKLQHPRTFTEENQTQVRKDLDRLLRDVLAVKARDLKNAEAGIETPEPKTEQEIAKAKRDEYLRNIDENTVLRARELMDEGAFNVRRFMANPDMNLKDAKLYMSGLKNDIGEEKFNKLANLSEEFHRILSDPLLKAMKESGKYTPEFMQKVALNRASYVTTNVLKYFELSPIRANTKQGKGTFDPIGDEMASTIMKTKAFLRDAYRQTMENSLIEIGQMGGVPNEIMPYKGNVYAARNTLQKNDPKNSYFVGYENGKATLIKMESPDLHRAMDSSILLQSPITKPFIQIVDSFNKLTLARELKTIFSAPFIAASRFYDTANEAILARAWEIPGLPRHVNNILYGIKQKAYGHADDYIAGKLTKDIQSWLDKGGLSYNVALSGY